MPKTRRQWSFREVDRLLRENGYKRVRSSGSHTIYERAKGKGNAVSIPHSPNAMIMRRLIKENGLHAPKGKGKETE